MRVILMEHPTKTMKPGGELDHEARDWLKKRTQASFVGLAIAGVISIITIGGPFAFAIIALWQHFGSRRLTESGQLVKARLIDPLGSPMEYRTPAEAWKGNSFRSGSSGDDEIGGALDFAGEIILALGRFIPAVLVSYAFSYRGRWHQVNKCMFTTETFYRDESSQAWALIDPDRPKLNHWLVGQITNGS